MRWTKKKMEDKEKEWEEKETERTSSKIENG